MKEVAVAVVRCEPSGGEIRVVYETTLLDAIEQRGLPIIQSCDGSQLCGFCRVHVVEGAENLTPPGDSETKVLRSLRADDDERLACLARVLGPVTVTSDYWD
jgi:ferredoxin